MGFPRQEYWSGLPFLSPGDLPNPGIEPRSPVSPALAGRLYHLGSPNPSGVTSVWSPQRGLCDKPKNQVFYKQTYMVLILWLSVSQHLLKFAITNFFVHFFTVPLEAQDGRVESFT